MKDNDSVAILRKCLVDLSRLNSLSNDDKEVEYDRISRVVSQVPRDGILQALDEAIGRFENRKKASIHILVELADVPAALDRMEALLRDGDESDAPELFQTVGLHHLIQFAALLNRFILGSYDDFTRSCAIHAASRLKDPRNLPALLKLTADCPVDLRFHLLVALTEFGDERGRPFLRRHFRNEEEESSLRVMAAWGLAKLSDASAMSYLIKTLDDPAIETDRSYETGQSLRAAQAICDVRGWEFEWHTSYVERTKKRLRMGQPARPGNAG